MNGNGPLGLMTGPLSISGDGGMGRSPGQQAGDAQGTEVQQTGWLMAKGRTER